MPKRDQKTVMSKDAEGKIDDLLVQVIELATMFKMELGDKDRKGNLYRRIDDTDKQLEKISEHINSSDGLSNKITVLESQVGELKNVKKSITRFVGSIAVAVIIMLLTYTGTTLSAFNKSDSDKEEIKKLAAEMLSIKKSLQTDKGTK